MLWLRSTVLCALSATVGGALAEMRIEKREEVAEAVPSTTVSPPPTEPQLDAKVPVAKREEEEDEEEEEPSPSDPPSGSAPTCYPKDFSVKPFCLPENEKAVDVGDTYFVTWDPDAFGRNSTLVIGLQYKNDTDGKSPYVSDETSSKFGFTTITMDEAWLQGEERNNLTVYIVENDPDAKGRGAHLTGPMISLAHKPTEHYPPPEHTSFNKLGLAIGLPVGLGVFFLILLGLCFGMRKKRHIGLGNIMGSGNKGYSTGQSRIERLGGRGRRRGRGGAAIRLANMEEGEQYRDSSHSPRRSDTDRFNEVQRAQGNAFSHDISKLKNWR